MLTSVNTLLTQKASKSVCKFCDYSTSRTSDYNRHILTAKHAELTQNAQKSAQKKSPTNCDDVMSICIDASDIEMTAYPSLLTVLTKKRAKARKARTEHKCSECNIIYASRVGLWKHNKKCPNKCPIAPENIITIVEKPQINPSMMSNIIEIIKQNQEFKEHTQELQSILLEQNNKIMGLMHKESVITHITNNNNNTMNNQFNINVFLNEKCKDALNISDFVDSLQIDFNDLEYVGTNGYVEGITKIILEGLDQLEVHKRPIHCTDKKRETLYIKDNDVWEKDTENKDKIRRFVGRVAKKNLNMVSPWQHTYPGIEVLDSPAYNLYMKIMRESINGGGQDKADRRDDKIIKNIARHVLVDKENEYMPRVNHG